MTPKPGTFLERPCRACGGWQRVTTATADFESWECRGCGHKDLRRRGAEPTQRVYKLVAWVYTRACSDAEAEDNVRRLTEQLHGPSISAVRYYYEPSEPLEPVTDDEGYPG